MNNRKRRSCLSTLARRASLQLFRPTHATLKGNSAAVYPRRAGADMRTRRRPLDQNLHAERRLQRYHPHDEKKSRPVLASQLVVRRLLQGLKQVCVRGGTSDALLRRSGVTCSHQVHSRVDECPTREQYGPQLSSATKRLCFLVCIYIYLYLFIYLVPGISCARLSMPCSIIGCTFLTWPVPLLG